MENTYIQKIRPFYSLMLMGKISYSLFIFLSWDVFFCIKDLSVLSNWVSHIICFSFSWSLVSALTDGSITLTIMIKWVTIKINGMFITSKHQNYWRSVNYYNENWLIHLLSASDLLSAISQMVYPRLEIKSLWINTLVTIFTVPDSPDIFLCVTHL